MMYYEYITQENDRWDLISYKFYGTPFLMEVIIKENPYVPIKPVLPAGIKLYIPVLENDRQIEEDMPPWKR